MRRALFAITYSDLEELLRNSGYAPLDLRIHGHVDPASLPGALAAQRVLALRVESSVYKDILDTDIAGTDWFKDPRKEAERGE